MSRFVTIVAVLMVTAAGLAKPVAGSASCAAGLVFDGDFYAQVGPLKSSDLAQRLAPARIPACNDVIVLGVDPQGKTVTDPPPPSPSVAVRPRAVRGISPRLAVAMPAGGGFALAVKGGACHNRIGVPDILACLRRRNRVYLQIDPTIAHPGATINLRVVAPENATQVSGARSIFLEMSATGTWTPTYDLIQPTPGQPGAPPQTLPYDHDRALRSFGIRSGTSMPVIVPNVPPGEYRILNQFGRLRLVADLRVVS